MVHLDGSTPQTGPAPAEQGCIVETVFAGCPSASGRHMAEVVAIAGVDAGVDAEVDADAEADAEAGVEAGVEAGAVVAAGAEAEAGVAAVREAAE